MHQPERLHALDAIRAFALLLGVVLHAAESFMQNFFPGDQGWVVADNSHSLVLTILVGAIHIFRMSLFFFIAGFFAHLVYHRKGAQAFARDRVIRIMLPFIFGWCVITPLLAIIWWWGQKTPTALSINALWPSSADWRSGHVRLTHLWFLYYLILAYVCIVGMRHLFADKLDASGRLRRHMDRALRELLEGNWAPVALALPLAIAAIFAPQWNPGLGMPTPDRSLIPELIPSVGYGVAFLVGWILHRDVSLLQVLTRERKAAGWIVPLSLVLMYSTAGILTAQPLLVPTLFRFLAALFATITMWYIIFWLVQIALNKFSAPSPGTRYVADASYWIYIAHLPLICVLQVWVANWPLHWTIKYPFILIIAFAILFASYHYLVRFTFIGAILNGRKYSKCETPVPRAHSATISED